MTSFGQSRLPAPASAAVVSSGVKICGDFLNKFIDGTGQPTPNCQIF